MWQQIWRILQGNNLGTSTQRTRNSTSPTMMGLNVQCAPLFLRLHTVSKTMPSKSAIFSLRCQASKFANRLHRHHATSLVRAPDTANKSITTSPCAGSCSCGLISSGSDWKSRVSFHPILPLHKFARIATMSSKAMTACHGHSEACCNIPPVVASGYSAKGSYEELGGLKTCKISYPHRTDDRDVA